MVEEQKSREEGENKMDDRRIKEKWKERENKNGWWKMGKIKMDDRRIKEKGRKEKIKMDGGRRGK